MERVLVTGSLGLVGSDLVLALQKKYGTDNVVGLDFHPYEKPHEGIFEIGDVTNGVRINQIVETYQITQIYHLAGILSAGSEKNPDRAWAVNLGGLKNILDIAKNHKSRVFWPSSIGVYGNTTPKIFVPQHTSLEPLTIYGVTKLCGEMLCQYYHNKFGVDVRSLRYPGINGTKADPGDGTTEYAIHIFYGLIRENRYTCFLAENTRLPMMYIDDAVRGTMMLMEAEPEKIKIRTGYNFSAVSFTPAELGEEIRKISPDFKVVYQPDERQTIAENWAQSIDDSHARNDWGWQEKYNLEKMTLALYKGVKERLEHE